MENRQAEPARCVSHLYRPAPEQSQLRLRGSCGDAILTIPRRLFQHTLQTLRARSAGWRESGAIWSGSVDADERIWRAERVNFHHDLGDDAAGPFRLELAEGAKFALYRELQDAGLRLIALIHTHPDVDVDHSPIDARNQICGRVGFWSLVVPSYGLGQTSVHTFGVHRRLDRGWYRLTDAEVALHVRIQG